MVGLTASYRRKVCITPGPILGAYTLAVRHHQAMVEASDRPSSRQRQNKPKAVPFGGMSVGSRRYLMLPRRM